MGRNQIIHNYHCSILSLHKLLVEARNVDKSQDSGDRHAVYRNAGMICVASYITGEW